MHPRSLESDDRVQVTKNGLHAYEKRHLLREAHPQQR
jgi:hypothetical protein